MSILAGNIVHIVVTITRPTGVAASVNPSTAKMALTTAAGTTTALTPTVSYNVDNSAVIVTADWTIPDAQADGLYTITVDTSGALVAAHEERIRVLGRRVTALP